MADIGLDARPEKKPGLAASLVVHIVVLGWGLLLLPATKPLETPPVDAVPVEIVSDAPAQSALGKPDAAKADTPSAAQAKPDKVRPDSKKAGNQPQDMPTPPAERPDTPEKAGSEQPPPVPPETPPKPPETPPEPPKPPQKQQPVKPPPAKPDAVKPPPPKAEPKPVEKAAKATPQDADALSNLVNKETAEPAKAPPKVPDKKPPEAKPPEAKQPEAKPAEDTAARTPAKTTKTRPDKKKPAPDADALAAAEEVLGPSAKGPAAKAATKKTDKFDPNKLEAMLGGKQAAGGGALAGAAAALGSETAAASTKLSQGEINALMRQIKQCWNIPPGAQSGDNLKVRLSFSLNQDGTLAGQPQVLQAPQGEFADVAAEAAVRAVIGCAPYQLPPEKYESWKSNTINFDPSRLF